MPCASDPPPKSWGENGFSRRRFFDLTLWEIFSPSMPFFCDPVEIFATKGHTEEKVVSPLSNALQPPCPWGFREKDHLICFLPHRNRGRRQ
jgi:hypothetical protein